MHSKNDLPHGSEFWKKLKDSIHAEYKKHSERDIKLCLDMLGLDPDQFIKPDSDEFKLESKQVPPILRSQLVKRKPELEASTLHVELVMQQRTKFKEIGTIRVLLFHESFENCEAEERDRAAEDHGPTSGTKTAPNRKAAWQLRETGWFVQF